MAVLGCIHILCLVILWLLHLLLLHISSGRTQETCSLVQKSVGKLLSENVLVLLPAGRLGSLRVELVRQLVRVVDLIVVQHVTDLVVAPVGHVVCRPHAHSRVRVVLRGSDVVLAAGNPLLLWHHGAKILHNMLLAWVLLRLLSKLTYRSNPVDVASDRRAGVEVVLEGLVVLGNATVAMTWDP